jgi:hypothetical protein
MQIVNNITLDIGQEILSATNIAAEINATTPASGINYNASSSGKIVYITAADNVGDAYNGELLTYGNTGTSTIATTNIDGGQSGSEVYSQINGSRFWLDADYGASGCSGSGTAVIGSLTNAIEITDKLAMRGGQIGGVQSVNTIDANFKAGSYTRLSNVQQMSFALGAPTTLEFISTDTANLYDIIHIYSSGSALTMTDVTVATQGNIALTAQTAFVSSGVEDVITLRLINDSTGLAWVEMSRSIAAIPALSIDTAELASTSVTTAKIAALAVTDAEINTDAVITAKILDANVTEAKLAAVSVTNGKIGLLAVDTPQMALVSVDDTIIASNAVITSKILDANITVAKLETALTKHLIVVPVTFEATGEMGLIKVTIPYDCTVTAIDVAVTLLIEATDDAVIIPKNNAGTAMTAGQIDLTGGSALGNIFTSTPSANNSFTAGQVLSLETSKVTVGGKALVSVELTQV